MLYYLLLSLADYKLTLMRIPKTQASSPLVKPTITWIERHRLPPKEKLWNSLVADNTTFAGCRQATIVAAIPCLAALSRQCDVIAENGIRVDNRSALKKNDGSKMVELTSDLGQRYRRNHRDRIAK